MAARKVTTTPTTKAISRPTRATTAIPRNVVSMYRLRLSPRATEVLSVPQVHSEPAIAAA